MKMVMTMYVPPKGYAGGNAFGYGFQRSYIPDTDAVDRTFQ